MSLINQMLKDLESRKTPDAATHSVLAGIGNNGKRGSSRGLLIGLVLIILALVSGMAFLMWRDNHSSVAPQAEQKAVTPQSTVAAAKVPSVAPKQAATRTEATQPVLVKKQSTTEKTQASTTPAGITLPNEVPAQQSYSAPVSHRPAPAVEQEEDNSYSSTQIEKRIRPLRPSQIAEQLYQSGYSLLQKGDQQAAEKDWLKALTVDAGQASSREALAALYYSQGRRVEAAEQLQKGLEIHPGNSQMALLYARLQIENGDTATAIATLEKALTEQAQNPDFYAFLAAIYQRQGDFQKSIAAYQKALSREPKQGVWWMGIAISLERAGKPEEALTAYNEAKDTRLLSPKLLEYVESRIKVLQ